MHHWSGSSGTELSIPPLPDHRPATYRVHYTTSSIVQSNAPEDGQNNCPKHVGLIGITNKQLLSHLFGRLLYYSLLYFVDQPLFLCQNSDFFKAYFTFTAYLL
jgi:hypothetical protein